MHACGIQIIEHGEAKSNSYSKPAQKSNTEILTIHSSEECCSVIIIISTIIIFMITSVNMTIYFIDEIFCKYNTRCVRASLSQESNHSISSLPHFSRGICGLSSSHM